MFEPSKTPFVDIRKFSVLRFYKSLNDPEVSPAPGIPARKSTSTVLVLQNQTKELEIFIGLFFPESGERVLYHSTPFHLELLSERLSEAQGFSEQMGFILEDKNFSK